jgi:cytoskeleton protein RodZ
LPTGAVILLGLILAVGAYIGWYRLSGEGRLPAETATTIPERLAPLAEQALPPATPSPTYAQAAPIAAPVVTVAAPAAVPPVPGPAVVVAAAVPVPLARDQPRVMLRASGDVWIQVKDKSGTVVLNRTLHQGDTWPVPPTPGLLLTTGNAAATEILVDGAATEPLGAVGLVRHDIALDVDQLKIGKPAPVGNTVPRPAQ